MVQSSVVEIMMSMFALEMEVRTAMFMSAWGTKRVNKLDLLRNNLSKKETLNVDTNDFWTNFVDLYRCLNAVS